MSKFKPKAQVMFEEKVEHYTSRRDWPMVDQTFADYGAYLRLIEPIPPDPEPEPSKELVFVGHNEPTMQQEWEYILSGEHARFCVEVLHVDPTTLKKLSDEELAKRLWDYIAQDV